MSYHYRMRLLFLILMMALMPLRGIAGDVMAIRMATQLPSQAAAVDAAPSGMTADHADCMGHSEAAARPGPAQGPDSQGHCATCPACQVCFSVALPWLVPTWSAAPLPHTVPFVLDLTFISAFAAPGLKPPIS